MKPAAYKELITNKNNKIVIPTPIVLNFNEPSYYENVIMIL